MMFEYTIIQEHANKNKNEMSFTHQIFKRQKCSEVITHIFLLTIKINMVFRRVI